MNDAQSLTIASRFVIEASNSNPAMRHGYERDNLADYEVHATRAAANECARLFLQRGHWVEIYSDATKELLTGPFDPDQAAPKYIV